MKDNQFHLIEAEITNSLRARSYHKNHLSWYKDTGDITLVFAIQRSQYSKEEWYYCWGICINQLSPKPCCSMSSCQITFRADYTELSPKSLIALTDSWENRHGDIRKLRRLAIQNALPGVCSLEAQRYLTMCNLSSL